MDHYSTMKVQPAENSSASPQGADQSPARQKRVMPPQRSLRECVIVNLTLEQMVAIGSRPGTTEFYDALKEVFRFALWRAYCHELQALEDPPIRMSCWMASRASSPRERADYRHAACRSAVINLVRDPSVRAEREALEIAPATSGPQSSNSSRRL